MGWATYYIARLKEGETVECNPRGNSMVPIIRSGQRCKIRPIGDNEEIKKGDIVLCKVKGKEYLHLVVAVNNKKYQIGNNRGGINGWVSRNAIYGRFLRNENS